MGGDETVVAVVQSIFVFWRADPRAIVADSYELDFLSFQSFRKSFGKHYYGRMELRTVGAETQNRNTWECAQ